MNSYVIQIAKTGVYHRWVNVNAATELEARSMAAVRYPDYTIIQVIDKGPA